MPSKKWIVKATLSDGSDWVVPVGRTEMKSYLDEMLLQKKTIQVSPLKCLALGVAYYQIKHKQASKILHMSVKGI